MFSIQVEQLKAYDAQSLKSKQMLTWSAEEVGALMIASTTAGVVNAAKANFVEINSDVLTSSAIAGHSFDIGAASYFS